MKAPNDDPSWKCTKCGRIGTVGRCCGRETRRPLNEAAVKEEQIAKSLNDKLTHEAGDKRL